MATSVLVEAHRSGAPPEARPRPCRTHGGPDDCGCGRTGCREDFATLAATADPAARTSLRTRLIEVHLDLAYGIAGRYRWPVAGFEDLRQVAALALVEAVNRFDSGMGTAFSAFAVPTIAGAIKRHFRDQSWMLHPPRRLKELRLRIRAATDPLAQQLRRIPTVADLAEHLGCGQEEIREALDTDDALRPLSLDGPVRTVENATLASTLGGPDAAYGHVEDVETLRPLLADLPAREQRVIAMRFAGNLTQSQIAEQVGCSQMHVSRILRAALDRLRRELQSPAPQDAAPARGSRREDRTPDDNVTPAARAGTPPSRPRDDGRHTVRPVASPGTPPPGPSTGRAASTRRRLRTGPVTITSGRTSAPRPGRPGGHVRRVPTPAARGRRPAFAGACVHAAFPRASPWSPEPGGVHRGLAVAGGETGQP